MAHPGDNLREYLHPKKEGNMGRLTTKQRKNLPDSDFAGKGRTYPVEDRGHAKSAIARAEEYNPPDKARIEARAEAVLRRTKPKSKK